MSCAKSEQSQNEINGIGFEKGQQLTLHITAGEPSTTVSSRCRTENRKAVDFKWEKGDVVKVTIGTESAEFTLIGEGGSQNGDFTGTMPASGDEFDVQYPYDTPSLFEQTYSTDGESIPHDKMLLKSEKCKVSDNNLNLEAQYAALRLNLWGTDQTISKIVVTNTTSTEATQPTYTLNISGGKALSPDSTNPTSFFVVVPSGNWNFSAKVYDNASPAASICTISNTSTDKYFTANAVLNMPVVEASPLISGYFTVSFGSDTIKGTSDDVVVKFSKGNLQATYNSIPPSYSWGFAGNQWDYIGNTAGNTTIDSPRKDGIVVDLFGWVGSRSTVLTGKATKYGISTSKNESDYAISTSSELKADWAEITTLPKVKGRKWHTLSWLEWYYLLFSRSVTVNGKNKLLNGEGIVNGVKGLILLPDNWDGSVCSGFIYGKSSYSNSFTESTIPKWSEMESAGCVFLPAAGGRLGSNVELAGSKGRYWSSSTNDDLAHMIYFESGSVGTDYRIGGCGCSVRLVSVAQ